MSKHATHCQFCKQDLVITVDDEYAEMGDPIKLIPFATCDRCADAREQRREVESKIARVCTELQRNPPKQSSPAATIARETLIKLTKAYAEAVSKIVGSAEPGWDIECVNLIMDHPEAWTKCIAQLWKMYEVRT